MIHLLLIFIGYCKLTWVIVIDVLYHIHIYNINDEFILYITI